MTSSTSLESLQNEWKTLFQKTLPDAACAKAPAQERWSVHVDHCFARIILDNVVGGDVPWMEKVKSPAWKHLTEQQLKECIKMGNDILEGKQELVELDEKSLSLRGKPSKTGKDSSKTPKRDAGKASGKQAPDGNVSRYFTKQTLGKRDRDEENISSDTKQFKEESVPAKKQKSHSPSPSASIPISPKTSPWHSKQTHASLLQQISKSSKTPFQQRVLSLLLEIPEGQYTTYGLLATHLSSSPRAVGNAIRNNPFAPDVPCHRVLATGGGIGGFYGSWGKGGKEGLHDDRKRKLLRGEGVRFDGKGRAVGGPWSGFE